MGPPPLLSREDSDYYHQAGPVPLPDDVPVDFLVGKMNLRVILPKGQCVRMSVERRYFIPPYTNEIILFFFLMEGIIICTFLYTILYFRTPMMDLLIQVTTANKINPGGHVIQVLNDRSDDFLYYKPSTPIGKKPLNV